MVDNNALGERGESILSLALTSLHGDKPLFRPGFLGAKWPVADFIVELEESPGRVFLIQAKATQKAIGKRSKRIPVDVDAARLQLLLAAPFPAYLAAIHEPSKSVYIGVPSRSGRIRSMGAHFPLDNPTVRETLRNEVKDFWAKQATPFVSRKSVFID